MFALSAVAAASLCSRSLGATRPAIARSFIRATLDSEDTKAFKALGYNIGRQMGELKVLDVAELDCVLAGMRSNILGEEPEVPLAVYVPKAAAMMQSKKAAAAEMTVAAGKDYLAAAGAETGAVTTPTGLVYLETVAGSGGSPSAADTVKVHYEGRLIDGTVFDSSIERGQPIEFPLNGVIAGWTEGLQLMKTGGKATLTIPPDIAYGDNGAPPAIPPKATLVFDVELIEVK